MDFAQKLIDDSLVHDVEKLETLAGQAMARAAVGPPPTNPLLEDDDAPAPRAAGGTRPATAPASAPAGAPRFPFDQIGSLDDAALAEALRSAAAIDAGKYGASDLHLSAGSRPFVRQAPRAHAHHGAHPHRAGSPPPQHRAALRRQRKTSSSSARTTTYALALGTEARYRVNLMFHKNGAAGAYRMVPAKHPHARPPRPAQHLATLKQAPLLPQRPHPHHRPRRLRQDHHPRLDGRLPQRDAHRPHHHRRGSHRGRPRRRRAATSPSARSAPHAVVLLRPQGRPPRRPRRHRHRRTPRPRDHRDGHQRLRDRPPRHRHDAHQRRRHHAQPPARRLSARAANADPRQRGRVAPRRRLPAPPALDRRQPRARLRDPRQQHRDPEPHPRGQDRRPAQHHGDRREGGNVPDGQRRLRPRPAEEDLHRNRARQPHHPQRPQKIEPSASTAAPSAAPAKK
jgi:hypothetical protein